MPGQTTRKHPARLLKTFRTIHRTTGALLFVFFFIVAVTGMLLGWKKHVVVLQAKNHAGISTDVSTWLPLDSLQTLALDAISAVFPARPRFTVDRLDVRPSKGMVKFLFTEDFAAVQLDATTGEILHIEYRTSDLIEHIHDGSIVDRFLGLQNGQFKLIYTTIMGSALLVFTITGFWLWYGPKRNKRKHAAI